MKQKSFHKGIEQLVQEGAIQLYKNYQTGEYMLGAVGQLQFEVFKHRMEGEYNAEVVMTPMGKKTVRWIKPEDLDERMSSSRNILVKTALTNPSSSLKTTSPSAGSRTNILMWSWKRRCSKYLGDICYREMETDGSQFTVE